MLTLNALEVFRLNQNLLWWSQAPSPIEETAAQADNVLQILRNVKAVWMVIPSDDWKWAQFLNHAPERNKFNVETRFEQNREDYEVCTRTD